jgi:RecG-like helicase
MRRCSTVSVADDGASFSATDPRRRAAHEPHRQGAQRILAAWRRTVDIASAYALIQERSSSSLGVVVIDEQHRFGVEQRAALKVRGDAVPDVLVTPPPRSCTAAMTVYGDLDVSILGEKPRGGNDHHHLGAG